MNRLCFDLYLDESGNFESDPRKQSIVSMVGGLLIPTHIATDQTIQTLVKERIHAKERYEHEAYFSILRQLISKQGKFVVFNNEERLSVINGDFTYLNIISEGIVQLIRQLRVDYPNDEVCFNIRIAWRQAMAYKRDQNIPYEESTRIQQDQYFNRIEEKLIIAIGRSKLQGIDWNIRFAQGDADKRLMLADLICFTWRFRNGRSFSAEEKASIENMFDDKYIFSAFENATAGSLRNLMIEERYEEVLYQLCNLRKLGEASDISQALLERIKRMSIKEIETLFSHMSLQIGRLDDAHRYYDGIVLAKNYLERILNALDDIPENKHSAVLFSRFDTCFYLLTMYDHVGNVNECEFYLNACKKNVDAVNHSWEHIDYYFRFRIRELNVMIGRFAFEEVLNQSDELVKIFAEARDLFSLIRTFDGTEQNLKSELLGKIYGIRVEVMINLLKRKPELISEAIDNSERAFAEFSTPLDICRQEQWRCLLMVEVGQVEEAIKHLLRIVNVQESPTPFEAFINTIYLNMFRERDYPLWHYTNTMLLLKQNKDARADTMMQALTKQNQFKNDLQDFSKGGHPWNLVVWNIARFNRLQGNLEAYRRYYNRALAITRENKANTTMLTFALSMSADQLLWCRKTNNRDMKNALSEFVSLLMDLNKAGLTDEMRYTFCTDRIKDEKSITDQYLEIVAASYLK